MNELRGKVLVTRVGERSDHLGNWTESSRKRSINEAVVNELWSKKRWSCSFSQLGGRQEGGSQETIVKMSVSKKQPIKNMGAEESIDKVY